MSKKKKKKQNSYINTRVAVQIAKKKKKPTFFLALAPQSGVHASVGGRYGRVVFRVFLESLSRVQPVVSGDGDAEQSKGGTGTHTGHNGK